MCRFWRALALAFFSAILMIFAGTESSASSHTEALSDKQQKAVEEIVREYILKNPEIILQSIENMRLRQQHVKSQTIKKTLRERSAELFRDPNSHVGGNPDGNITLVEFFDYRCSYCKRVHPTITKLLKSDGNIRFVYKEYPSLGPESVFAARAAIASRSQGKYVEFHNALIELRGSFAQSRVLKAAQDVGLNVEKLAQEIEDQKAKANKIFRLNYDLAEALDISGTPAFIVGDIVIRGAVELSALKEAIASARTASKANGR
jgi:protein-disulfide isomerase